MDEQKLIGEILQGSQKAFAELVAIYQDKVYNTIHSFVHDDDEAMDLSQEVFVEIFLSLENFRKESGLSTWIYRIAVNKSLSSLRKKKRNSFISRIQSTFDPAKHHAAPEPSDTGKQPDEAVENTELGKQLQQAIASLPKNQRIAFILHKYEELPYKEIAGIMNISLASVESLIFRARKGLQEKLLQAIGH